ncbi:MarR family winged helix-turn-helix transcriptional regulator [Aerococcus urinaeequi]
MRESFYNFTHTIYFNEFNIIRNVKIGDPLSYSDTLLLFIIKYKNRMAISELAEYINLSRPAVTQKVNALEKRGLVVKTQSTKDKRVFYLSLSEKVLENCNNARMTDILDEAEKNFSEQEKKVFVNILQFITDYILNND